MVIFQTGQLVRDNERRIFVALTLT